MEKEFQGGDRKGTPLLYTETPLAWLVYSRGGACPWKGACPALEGCLPTSPFSAIV